MSGLDLNPIRERQLAFAHAHARLLRAGEPGLRDDYRAAHRALCSVAVDAARDVSGLLAEVERLAAEVFTLTNSEDARLTIAEVERDSALGEAAKLREWNHEIKAERDDLAQRCLAYEAELRDARFGLIGERDDALQVVVDLSGGGDA